MKKKTIISIIAIVRVALLIVGAVSIFNISKKVFQNIEDVLDDFPEDTSWSTSDDVSTDSSDTTVTVSSFSKADLDIVAKDNSDIALLGFNVTLKPNTKYLVKWSIDEAVVDDDVLYFAADAADDFYVRYVVGADSTSPAFEEIHFPYVFGACSNSTGSEITTDSSGEFSLYLFEMDFVSVENVIAAKALVDTYVTEITITEVSE